MNVYEYYKIELASKKTNTSKKAFLTRELNKLKSHLTDLIKHQKPNSGNKFGYLFGEPVTPIRVTKVKTEMQVIINLRNQLK
jgi:hypothetical protein